MSKQKTSGEFKKYSQLLLATKIFNEYIDVMATLISIRRLNTMYARGAAHFPTENVEPEKYVEDWLNSNLICGDEDFRHGILEYFSKLFIDYFSNVDQNGEKNE